MRRCKPAGRPDTTRRVVRGGSWNNNRDNARCAYRNDNDPGNRNNNLGLRLVCVSHIVQAF
ncbi:MAG: Serine/threonine-protein kinase pkn1 [Accumulibacter sp.]|uniref:formylglycine-generating enzyme family protein n=1 Tax=Accumulibacter sp. TaxID=2053492 RepID=UPI00122BFF69|nr:SUMF1/EgtB/PvdO family nonheme iron enzyme [Accumulibacter sp.]TLD45951.1 MAG: Serine/threonine-protein kinase pkn1 [Accumulibacter sp.]